MSTSKDLVIVGAGPYGLATAVCARHQGLDMVLLGRPMEFWKRNMPPGMLLRSPVEWHLDPLGRFTIAAYLEQQGRHHEKDQPIEVELFLDYARWFQAQAGLTADPSYLSEMDWLDPGFRLRLDSGQELHSHNVVLAPGFRPFALMPTELLSSLPATLYHHSSELPPLESLQGQRILMLGGRQSAFEYAALIREAGAAEVHIVHRHDTPRFETSDWAFVDDMMQATQRHSGWFRSLPAEQRDQIRRRFWSEGRARLEPWLPARLAHENIRLYPNTTVTRCEPAADTHVRALLSSGQQLVIDRLILATGYSVDVQKLDYLSPRSILPHLELRDGYPALDEHFQSSIPGLYFTGMVAANDFGPFFGFVRACPTSARILAARLAAENRD